MAVLRPRGPAPHVGRRACGRPGPKTNQGLGKAVRLEQDKGDDLWKVFNIVQEKITQGDFSAALRGAKVRKVRKIKSFEKDLKVNQDLFKLATSLVAA